MQMEGPFFSEKKKGAQNGAFLRLPDADEFLNVERIPLEKAVEMVMNHEIPDAKTQVAVLKTAVLLNKLNGK